MIDDDTNDFEDFSANDEYAKRASPAPTGSAVFSAKLSKEK